jgi:RHS repeat-associated protein
MYAYDARGQRFSHVANGVLTKYLWDSSTTYGDIAIETMGNVETQYLVGAVGVLGQLETNLQTQVATPHYLLADGLGSTRGLLDGNGATVETYLYDAFGPLRNGPATPQTSYLYTGQQFDSGINLYNLRARTYSSETGRFLSRDTYHVELENPKEINRYLYVAHNPTNYTDPSGYMLNMGMTASRISIPAIMYTKGVTWATVFAFALVSAALTQNAYL